MELSAMLKAQLDTSIRGDVSNPLSPNLVLTSSGRG